MEPNIHASKTWDSRSLRTGVSPLFVFKYRLYKMGIHNITSNSARVKVEQMLNVTRAPTLVHYEGSMCIQHPIVYSLMKPILEGD